MPSDHVGRVAGTAAAIALLVCLGLLSNRSWSPPLVSAAAKSRRPITPAAMRPAWLKCAGPPPPTECRC